MDYSFFDTESETTDRLNAALNKTLRTALVHHLCDAADAGDADAFREIVQAYPEIINDRNADGDTPLICAAYNGRKDMVDQLLALLDIDVNAKGEDGVTALMWACEQGHTEIGLQLLARPEINITVQDDYHDTALILSVEEVSLPLLAAILQRADANVEQKNKAGDSALSLATKNKTAKGKGMLQQLEAHVSHSKPAPEVATEAPPAPAKRPRARPPIRNPKDPA